MKFLAMVIALTSLSAFGASVHSAKLDASQKNILVDVSYGGGCKKHNFALSLILCAETFPLICTAKLVETVENGPDLCEAIVAQTVKINLEKNGFLDGYYTNALIRIEGDKDSRGIETSATVTLP